METLGRFAICDCGLRIMDKGFLDNVYVIARSEATKRSPSRLAGDCFTAYGGSQ